MKFLQKFDELTNIQGTNAKRDYLKAQDKDDGFKQALRFLLDDNVITGIREKKWDKIDPAEKTTIKDFYKFISEHNTGKDDDIANIKAFFASNPEWEKSEFQNWVRSFVTKTWRLGCDAKSANKVYGDDFIKQFSVLLCDKYFDDPEYWTDKEFIINLKLDGMRTVAIKRNGVVRLWSRSGKIIEGFTEIEQAVAALPVDDIVLDGERMPIGFMEMDNKQQFKLVSNGQCKGEKTGYCIAVYDYLHLADWDAQKSDIPYRKRYDDYMKLLHGNKFLFPLPSLYTGKDTKQIEKWLKWAKDNHKEGVIVNDVAAPYIWDRGQNKSKVKVFNDIDVIITGFEEGGGKNKGKCGAIVFKYKGNLVKAGSGLNDYWRKEFWDNQKKYIGRTAELVYFEETESDGVPSLRHPVFKCLKDGN